MLIHLPIVVMATLSPIPVADGVPKLDIAKECSFEGGTSEAQQRCVRDENEALQQLQGSWSQYTAADRSSCTTETVTGGYASYIELQSCLEMARDAAAAERGTSPGTESQPKQAEGPDRTVGEAHDR
jgi:hypothetical protein